MKTFPKAAKYDKRFVEENWMGPNPLELLEAVCHHLDFRPGMNVLDMGCGKGLTSVFLAKEYDVIVFANDLWIDPTDNWKRFEQMGVSNRVYPIHADAHALPYAEGFFDAAVSIDSYHYYGANETYLPEVFSKLVKPGGQFGIACPGLTAEVSGIPENLKGFWKDEMDAFSTFHTAQWWKNLWEHSGLVEITSYGEIENARVIWSAWADWAKAHLGFNDREVLDADQDGLLTIMTMTAVKKRQS